MFAIGSRACRGGSWFDTYNVMGGADRVIPVDFYVPGCPPSPLAFMQGLRRLREAVAAARAAAQAAGVELESVCGGAGSCGGCRVRLVTGELSPPTPAEEEAPPPKPAPR